MAVLAYCGFELGERLAEGLGAFVSAPDPVSTVQRTGKFSQRFNAPSGISIVQIYCPDTTVGRRATGFGGSGSSTYVTIWLRVDTAPTSDQDIIYWDAGKLVLKTDRTLQLYYDGSSPGTHTHSTVGSPSTALSTGVWHRIDIKIKFPTSTTLDTECKLDKSSFVSSTGLSYIAGDYLNGGNAFQIGPRASDATLDIYFDDFIARDNDYESSDGGVLIMRPDSDGNYTAWTGTWSDVDEVPVSTSDDIHATAVSQAETEGLRSASTSGIAGTIVAASPYAVVYNVGTTGLPTMALRLRTGGSDFDGSSASALDGTTNRRMWMLVKETNPNTSAAWTSSDLDSVEVGVVAVTGPTGTNLPTAAALGMMVWCTSPQSILAPIVTSVSPTSGPKAGGTSVTITGENFTNATSAIIGGNNITSFSVVSDTSITGVTAAASKAGVYSVSVVGPAGVGTLLNAFTFTPGNSGGQSGNNAGGSTSLIVNMPSTATGDQLIAVITVRGTGTTVTQASWGTAIDIRSDGTNSSTHTFKRISTGGSEPATYTFTLGTSVKASGVITSTPDVDTTAGPRVSSQANSSSANVVAPTLTPRRLGSVSIYGGGTATGTTFTPPSNYTEPANSDNASTGGSAGTRTTTEQAYRQLTSLAATGTLTGVAGAAATNVGVQVMLDPPTVADIQGISSSEAVGTPALVGQTVTLIQPSAIAGAEAVGSHTLLHGGVNILPSAIASSEAIGSHILKPTNIIDLVNQAIASAEAIGSHTLKAIATILPSAIASGEAFGAPILLPGGVVIVPTGIASSQAFGTVTLYALATIAPTGVASAEVIGSHTLIPGAVLIVPSGITSSEIIGSHILKAIASILPTGIASSESTGTPTLLSLATIIAQAIASAEAVGSHTLLPGIVAILPSGIAGAEAIGAHTLLHGGVSILPNGIVSSEVIGSHTLLPGTVVILPSGMASTEAFGSATLLHGGVLILPNGISSAELIGSHTLLPGSVLILPGGIGTGELFGTPLITITGGGGPLIIIPSGISSTEALGSPTVLPGTVIVIPTAIGSVEALGAPVILPGSVSISPQGLVSDEAVPSPQILPGGVLILPVAVGSQEALGSTILAALNTIFPGAITSEEQLGQLELLPGGVQITVNGISSSEVFGTTTIRTFVVGSWQWLSRLPAWQTTHKRGWPGLQDSMARTRKGGDE